MSILPPPTAAFLGSQPFSFFMVWSFLRLLAPVFPKAAGGRVDPIQSEAGQGALPHGTDCADLGDERAEPPLLGCRSHLCLRSDLGLGLLGVSKTPG